MMQTNRQYFGLLPLNKPAGITSRRAVDAVKKLVKPAKVGHTGTLDPLAEGVLVVCVGPATRLASFVQQTKKSYVGTFRLGVSSNTDDVEGKLTPLESPPEILRSQLQEALPEFIGKIEQVPPAYSAIKIDGKRAYQLARAGNEVDMQAREVDVYEIELIEFDYPEFKLQIDCGAGTYIRSIGRDIGRKLDSAAVMTGLTRTAVGQFKIDQCVSLSELSTDSVPQHLISPTFLFDDLPCAILGSDQIRKLVNGGSFKASELNIKPGLPRITALDSNNNFLALLRTGQTNQEYRIEVNFANHFVNPS